MSQNVGEHENKFIHISKLSVVIVILVICGILALLPVAVLDQYGSNIYLLGITATLVIGVLIYKSAEWCEGGN